MRKETGTFICKGEFSIVLAVLLLGVFLLGGLSSGCQKGQQVSNTPDWINNFRQKYPEDKYFVALGRARTEIRARDEARADIARIFSQQIDASRSLQEQISEKSGDEGGEFVRQIEEQSEVQTATQAKITGIEIVESHKDFQSNENYALAVLDRERMSGVYRQRFRDKISAVEQYYQRAKRADSKIDRLRFLSQALKAAIEADRLAGHLRVISPRREVGLNVEPGPATIDGELRGVLSDLTVYVNKVKLSNVCPGSGLETIMQSWIREAFTSLDFYVADSEGEADIVIKGKLSTQYEDRAENVTAVRWDITLDLINSETGRSFGTISHRGYSDARERSRLASRTRFHMREWVDENMDKLITETLLSD